MLKTLLSAAGAVGEGKKSPKPQSAFQAANAIPNNKEPIENDA